MSYDTEYVRKYKAFNCTVTSSGGGGDEGWSGVDMAVPESQQEIVKAVHLTPQVQADCNVLETVVHALAAMMRPSSARLF